MSQPLLSILIPTVVGRENEFSLLFARLYRLSQVAGHGIVSIGWEKDNKELSIGEKRELLYKKATGLYSLQVDDDDDMADNAIELFISNIKRNNGVPCITYREKCVINGEYKSSNHSIKYAQWQNNFDGFDYVRSPFYKDVIRTDIAQSVAFEHIRWNEDERWSYAIKPFLSEEIHIDEELYYYIHSSTEPTERYGLNK